MCMSGTVCYAFTNSAICKAPVCGSIWIAALDLNGNTKFFCISFGILIFVFFISDGCIGKDINLLL